jgi:glutaredoxin
MNFKSVRLFIKPGCPWCIDAVNWLKNHKINAQILDVISNPSAFAEMRNISGQTYAPVIEIDGHVLADFGVDELEKFVDKLKNEH